MMRNKLGLLTQQDNDEPLIADLLAWMKDTKADYTNTFLDLTRNAHTTQPHDTSDAFAAWHTRWQARLAQNDQPLIAAQQRMQQTNPAIIPRNHQVEVALAAATEGNLQPFHDLHAALQSPYHDHKDLAPYQLPPGPDACHYQTFCGT